MPSKPLSPAMQNSILAAVSEAAEKIAAGVHPTQAAVKAAAAQNIPPGAVRQMVYGLNTGRVRAQHESSDDVFSKAAQIDLADADEVLELLYPGRLKTAAQEFLETDISKDYLFSPDAVLQEKEAAEHPPEPVDFRLCDPPAPLKTDTSTELRRQYGKAEGLRKQADETRRQTSALVDQITGGVHKLAAYFTNLSSLPISVVSENAEILHGEKAAVFFREFNIIYPGLAKMPQHKEPSKSAAFAPAEGHPYELLTQIFEATAALPYKQALAAEALKEAETAELSLKPKAPVLKKAAEDIIDLFDPAELEKLAAGFGAIGGLTNMLSMTANGLSASKDRAVQKSLDSLTDPDHDARLRSINSQAMLQDLISNDPVISSHPPHKVLTAFNDLAQAAPAAADQKLLMQAGLRRSLEQGVMDTFDVSQLLDADTKLRLRNAGPAGQGAPNGQR